MNFTFNNRIFGIPVNQNQQEFIVGVFKIGQILTFTRYTKRVIRDFDEKGEPIYNREIQREVENSRVEKIADFLIKDPEATFPTNLVLHIPEEVILKQRRYDGFIEIFINEKVYEEVKKEASNESAGNVYISIIDGQHRVRGIEIAIKRLQSDIKIHQQTINTGKANDELQKRLEYYSKRLNDLLNIELVVSFFISKQLEYQAMIFSTINRTQKRVSESLVYSLFGLTLEDSPQKSALQITLELNAREISPFYNRIKLYGGDYDTNQTPPLSQATMVKSIVALISENLREAENDRFRKRKELFARSISSTKDLPFRKYYAANKDSSISDILFYFFSSVRKSFKVGSISLWDFNPDTMRPTNVLQTTLGYLALLEILVDILEHLPEAKRYSTIDYQPFTDVIATIDINNHDRYPFTSKSRKILYYDISLLIWPPTSPNDQRLTKLNEALRND